MFSEAANKIVYGLVSQFVRRVQGALVVWIGRPRPSTAEGRTRTSIRRGSLSDSGERDALQLPITATHHQRIASRMNRNTVCPALDARQVI
jgi:hypothetical protein